MEVTRAGSASPRRNPHCSGTPQGAALWSPTGGFGFTHGALPFTRCAALRRTCQSRFCSSASLHTPLGRSTPAEVPDGFRCDSETATLAVLFAASRALSWQGLQALAWPRRPTTRAKRLVFVDLNAGEAPAEAPA